MAGIASYSWTDRFSTAFRGEFFHDSDGSRRGGEIAGTHADVSVGGVALTGAYGFTAQLYRPLGLNPVVDQREGLPLLPPVE